LLWPSRSKKSFGKKASKEKQSRVGQGIKSMRSSGELGDTQRTREKDDG
jgi:hypothetical protein